MSILNSTTSESRPNLGTADVGTSYFETDTNKILVWDGSAFNEWNADLSSFNNYSLAFDGTDEYMKTTGFTLGSAYSFSVWFNLDVDPATRQHTLLTSEHYFTSDYDNFVFRVTNATRIQLFSYSGTSSAQSITITVPTLSTGTWYNIVLTNPGDGSTAQGYLNGSSVTTSGSTSRSFSDLQGSKGLIVGDDLTNRNAAIDGKIDEVAVFNYSLSSSDATSIYNNGVPANLNNQLSTGPLGWWRMGDNNAGTGTTVTDQGVDSNGDPSGNDGTIVNGPTFSTSVPI